MSHENVELLRRFLPAADEDLAQLYRDDESWMTWAEALIPFVHADFESIRVGVPDGEVHTGLDEARALFLEWLAPWVTYRVETDETVDIGDRVLQLGRVFGRLEGSGAQVEQAMAAVYTFRYGKLARVEYYLDRSQALKAVGLEE